MSNIPAIIIYSALLGTSIIALTVGIWGLVAMNDRGKRIEKRRNKKR